MANILTSGEQILQNEIDRLHSELAKVCEDRDTVRAEYRRLHESLQDAFAQVRDMQTRVDHLTDEAKRWRAGE
jgi:uncharacterized small protein (DUF1192 family)